MTTARIVHADRIIEPDIDWRRVRNVPVAAELVEAMVTEGTKFPSCRYIQGLPNGAQLVNANYDKPRRLLILQFYHPQFEAQSGPEYPEETVLYQELRQDLA